MSLHELFGTTVPLDALLGGAEVERARDRIASAPTHAARVAIVEALLVARAHDAAIDRMAVEAVRRIETAGGRLRISDLARDLGITHDPLEKRFRRAIGASPKQLAMLVRIRRAIALATARRERVGLARIALDAGYFDQSHFNRELRAVTGASPTQFFGDTAYC
jgi:AraC-like DNA-binding protein